jgi:MraZ protein
MFLGTYRTKLDDKSRLTLPRAWVHEFSQGLILTRGVDESLLVFPTSKFESIARGLDELGLASADGRKWTRFLSALAIDLLPDKKGRIPISLSQLKFAGIANDVALVGLLSYVQIWDPLKHEELVSRDATDIIEIANRVDKLIRAPVA